MAINKPVPAMAAAPMNEKAVFSKLSKKKESAAALFSGIGSKFDAEDEAMEENAGFRRSS